MNLMGGVMDLDRGYLSQKSKTYFWHILGKAKLWKVMPAIPLHILAYLAFFLRVLYKVAKMLYNDTLA